MIIPRVTALEIHITYRCTLRCPQCANCVSIAPCNEDMSIEWLLKVIHESIALNYPWEWLVLHGGEPCLHPKIETIYLLLQAYKIRWNMKVNLKITTNGYGEANKAAMELAAAYGFEICDSHKDGTPEGYKYHAAMFNSPRRQRRAVEPWLFPVQRVRHLLHAPRILRVLPRRSGLAGDGLRTALRGPERPDSGTIGGRV